MRNIIIGVGVLAVAAIAYLALGTSPTEHKPSAETSSANAEESSKGEAAKSFVTPRRMRSDSTSLGDELSGDSRRRMGEMGRGDRVKHRANLQKTFTGKLAPSDETRSGGQVEREEVIRRRTQQWITDADKDADGLLSPSEAELGSPRLRLILSDFDAADSDGDGAINEEELKRAAMARRATRRELRQTQ